MTRRAAATALLAGPAVLAFFTGGYGDTARTTAAAVAWALAAIGIATRRRAPTRAQALAVGAALALTAWTALSVLWAPTAGAARDLAQITGLYAGALLAASLLLRDARSAELVLAVGTLVVIGYGISERLLPGLLDFERSTSAFGRLEQPLTYWNATGGVAALGIVLCARLAGDATRGRGLRIAAAAAAAPLGLGLYLTVSRGAMFACLIGLAVLVVADPDRGQLRAIVVVAAAAVLGGACAVPFDAVRHFDGELGVREREGLEALLLLAWTTALAAHAARLLVLGRTGAVWRPPRAGTLLAVAAVAVVAVAPALGEQRAERPLPTGASRLATFASARYDYWRVALRAAADAPLIGVGPGGWAQRWRTEREVADPAHDAHSLVLQTLAELGVVGLALLSAACAGVALAARRAGPAGVGAIAGCAVWLVRAGLDWDFQLPAATLPAMVLAGALLAQSASAMRGASRSNTHTASTQTAT